MLGTVAIMTAGSEQQTRFVITKPTLISFFLDYTDKEIAADGGNESLSDFVYYLPQAEDKLRAAGVQVYSVFKVKSFQVKVSGQWRTVRPRVTVGYYFIAPGREPKIEFGVQDTEAIMDLAREYF